MMAPITATSVLPAQREPVTLRTSDGLRLIGELALPESGPPAGLIVCLHPLTTHGGMMDSHVFRKAAWRLPALAGIGVLRFNMRGAVSAAGASEGAFDECRGEGLDLAAALAFVGARELPAPWLVGWSFGTDVTLRYGNVDPVRGAILLSPPLRYTQPEELLPWAVSGRPLVALVPEYDDYVRPAEAAERFASAPQAEVVGIPDGRHLWVGERFVREALDQIVARVCPGHGSLPTDWDGPMEKFTETAAVDAAEDVR
jgi:alpha/beta superfamily hydrolase